jgi:hypothetical protein
MRNVKYKILMQFRYYKIHIYWNVSSEESGYKDVV